ncbi:MAG: DUF1566 domain-containing protein, partial [Spirochaetia bacterium]|nr:DUF1566 domain-containing protein [Spirochaetia bacterium]
YRDSSCTQRYYFTTDVVTYSMTLYAKWFPPHSVSFDSQGGSNVGDITDITHGDLIPEPLAPSKSGYAFDGWHKQSSYVEQWDFDADEITSDMTLYAKWIVLHLVSFDSRGGSGVAAIEIGNGRKLVEPTAPTRPGYIFVGWYKEIACINRWNFSLDNVESTRTLYAKWIVLHLVSFDSRGGSGVAAIEVGNGRKLAEPATPIKTGYTFGGWYKEIACINQWNFSLDNVESTRTLYAKWTARNYTVTFDSQGGSSPNPASKSVTYDQTYGTLPTLTRNGYTFDGWWTEPDVTETQVTPDAIVSITSDLTLYAKWIGILKVRDIGPGGGHVFYDKGWETDGWRYLEAAPAGWSGGSEGPSRVWGGSGTAVGGTGTGIGTGASNTQKIVAKFGNAEPYGKKADYAAKVCADYRGGGYADWFLPSREELSLMYQNLKKPKLGGFSGDYYWSSSENSAYSAWYQDFYLGTQNYNYNRYYFGMVRPVRAF